MAQMLSEAGYATGAFGKWHLGHTEGRFPTDQGFDEWYGIPNSSDESFWPDNPRFRPESHPYARVEYLMEGHKGEAPEKVRVYNSEERLLIDTELTRRTIDFMGRQIAAKKPFFAYVPYTQPHMPTIPHPDFKNKTHNGDFADVLTEIDAHVGQLLDAVDRLGIRDNTIFVFTSDNGPEFSTGYEGSSGPWHGTYFTNWEVSLRVPFIIRWLDKVPARRTRTILRIESNPRQKRSRSTLIKSRYTRWLATKGPQECDLESSSKLLSLPACFWGAPHPRWLNKRGNGFRDNLVSILG
jgi:arylsulfatase A-like enzyme